MGLWVGDCPETSGFMRWLIDEVVDEVVDGVVHEVVD